MQDAQNIQKIARAYASADDKRAWLELGVTLFIYCSSLYIAVTSIGAWWMLIPSMCLASLSGLRIYMIQHDCFHRSFFSNRKLNDWVGTLVSPISMTPYQSTRYIHNQHHNHVSDLNHRETFEIPVMTLEEWNRASPGEQLLYRMKRSPLTLIFLGPFVLYVFVRRFPVFGYRAGWSDLVLHNLMVAALVASVWYIAGWPGVFVWAAAIYVACLFGSLIPYVVHNFEEITWGVKPELDFETAALKGSSVLDWGWAFDVAMMNIGYHDLHHLNAKIPGYKLKKAHKDLESKGLISSHKIGLIDSVKCLRWKLYDEENEKMIPFPQNKIQETVSA
ncbi:MAG: fatty acid desaturase [Pseudomonadota bacterium]